MHLILQEDSQVWLPVLIHYLCRAALCSTSVNINIATAPGAPDAPATTVTDPTCATPTGTITVTSSTAGLTFSLDGGAYAPYPAGGFTGVASGAHTLSVQNAALCSTSVNVNIATAPGAPDAPTTTITDPTCATPTGTITVTSSTAGLTFSLDGGAYAPYPAGGFTGVASGAHTLSVQNAALCSTSVNINIVTAPGAPDAPATTVTDPTCATPTGTITITSSTAGLTFSLDGGAYAPYPAGGFTGVASGAHTLSVQNAALCSTSVNINIVTAPGAPDAPATTVTDPTCATPTGTITITSSTAGLTFSLDGGAYAPYPAGGFTGVASGAHTLSVQNAALCSTSVNINIATAPGAPDAPTPGTISQPTCAAATGSVILNGLPASGWTINPGAIPGTGTSTTITGLAPATYNFTVTDASGCTSIGSADVVINALPSPPEAAVVNTTQPSCSVSTGSIIVTAPLGAYDYSIDGGPFQASASFTGVAAGLHNILVRSTADYTCISTATTVTINTQPAIPPAPTVGTISQPTCTVATGTVILNNLPVGDWTINPGAITGTGTNTTISGLTTGTYNFTVTNTAGCTSAPSSNVVIQLPAANTVRTNPDPGPSLPVSQLLQQ